MVEVVTSQSNFLAVYSTHLDVFKEETRLEQLQLLQVRKLRLITQLISWRQESLQPIPHILIGDFNAVNRGNTSCYRALINVGCKGDYNEEGWSNLMKVRSKNHLEPPKPELYEKMLSLGYKDALTAVGTEASNYAKDKSHRDCFCPLSKVSAYLTNATDGVSSATVPPQTSGNNKIVK